MSAEERVHGRRDACPTSGVGQASRLPIPQALWTHL